MMLEYLEDLAVLPFHEAVGMRVWIRVLYCEKINDDTPALKSTAAVGTITGLSMEPDGFGLSRNPNLVWCITVELVDPAVLPDQWFSWPNRRTLASRPSFPMWRPEDEPPAVALAMT